MRLHPSRKPRGRQHRTQRLHHKQRTTRTMRRARSRTCPTPSPTTRSARRRPRSPTWQRTTSDNENTTQHMPNSVPYTRTTSRRQRSLTGPSSAAKAKEPEGPRQVEGPAHRKAPPGTRTRLLPRQWVPRVTPERRLELRRCDRKRPAPSSFLGFRMPYASLCTLVLWGYE